MASGICPIKSSSIGRNMLDVPRAIAQATIMSTLTLEQVVVRSQIPELHQITNLRGHGASEEVLGDNQLLSNCQSRRLLGTVQVSAPRTHKQLPYPQLSQASNFDGKRSFELVHFQVKVLERRQRSNLHRQVALRRSVASSLSEKDRASDSRTIMANTHVERVGLQMEDLKAGELANFRRNRTCIRVVGIASVTIGRIRATYRQ